MELEIYQTGALQVNTYLLKDEISKEAVLIDIGGSFERLKKHIEDNGYTLKYVLNTHGHFDHIMGEIEIQKNYPEIPIYIHKGDEPHYSQLQEEMNMWGFNCEVPPLKPTKTIDENEELFIGKNKIQIFYTPGHSEGSLSYYIDGKIFTGDTLFQRSIGRTDFFDGDYDTLIESIKSKILTLPEETLVFPGHGPSTTVKEEKKYNTYFK